VVAREGSQLDERAVLEYLQARLARYKLPKSVAFTSELPRNPAGKILKPALRERFGGEFAPV
jgi:acyl-CoA synthetase (AMP-forming)/AMP-acid ligase II